MKIWHDNVSGTVVTGLGNLLRSIRQPPTGWMATVLRASRNALFWAMVLAVLLLVVGTKWFVGGRSNESGKSPGNPVAEHLVMKPHVSANNYDQLFVLKEIVRGCSTSATGWCPTGAAGRFCGW